MDKLNPCWYVAEEFIREHLKPPLVHGDAQHQEWLKEELRKWIPELAEEFRGFRCGDYGYESHEIPRN